MNLKIALCGAALICATTVSAQDVPQTKETVNVPTSASMLSTAGQLVKYGYEEGEALPLIQAADIYLTFAGKQMDAKPEQEGGVESAQKADNKVTFDPQKLLADATVMADGDSTLLALIDNIKNSATRGSTLGVSTTTEVVKAKATDTYTVRFRGGEEAMVIVSGDGDTDLDLFVYDENNNLIDSDTDNTDDCVCVWVPKRTGNFKIKVKNYGNISNRYVIGVN